MSEHEHQGGAAAQPPPGFTGNDTPGQGNVAGAPTVTPAGDDSQRLAAENAGLLADENAELRRQLQSENDRLRTQLDESRAANADAEGYTDEDVRRIERPHEYADADAQAQHDGLRGRIDELEGRLSGRSREPERTTA